MELEYFLWVIVAIILGTIFFLSRAFEDPDSFVNSFVKRLGKKRINTLPPGDMGWPLIGNTWSLIRALKSQNPESFINNLKTRYGETSIYKTSLFLNPTIIVCSPELCRKVLTSDEQFELGYPFPSLIFGDKPIDYISSSGQKRFRRVTSSRINGQSLITYIECIEKIVITALEELAKTNQPIEFSTEMTRIAFKIIMTICLGSASEDSVIASMETQYTCLFHGLFCAPVNIPGFAYHRAVKARKMLLKMIQDILVERREKLESCNDDPNSKIGVIDFIKEVEVEEGEKLDDEYIIIVILVYLLAGNETMGRAATWATINLYNHPQVLQKAKEEQEEIIKRRPPSEKGLTFSEIKQMKYLSKVIDETLRMRTNIFALLRRAKNDINLDEYFIPKGWKVLVWQSAVHMDPEIYTNPKEFLPSRWDDLKPKAGTFQPFGAGINYCPGADLAKLTISIFLHHFLLNYKLEQLNPGSPVNYLPSPDPVDNCLAKIIKLG